MKTGQLIVSILVANQPGALIRVSSLFAKRGINISSLHVEQLEPETARIMLVADSGAQEMGLITRQLEKIYDVKKVEMVEAGGAITRKGLFLTKGADDSGEDAAKGLANGALLVEVTGNSKNLSAFVDYLRPYGMIEMAAGGQKN